MQVRYHVLCDHHGQITMRFVISTEDIQVISLTVEGMRSFVLQDDANAALDFHLGVNFCYPQFN